MTRMTVDEEIIKASLNAVEAEVDNVAVESKKYQGSFQAAYDASRLKFLQDALAVVDSFVEISKLAQEAVKDLKDATNVAIADFNQINEDSTGLGSIE